MQGKAEAEQASAGIWESVHTLCSLQCGNQLSPWARPPGLQKNPPHHPLPERMCCHCVARPSCRQRGWPRGQSRCLYLNLHAEPQTQLTPLGPTRKRDSGRGTALGLWGSGLKKHGVITCASYEHVPVHVFTSQLKLLAFMMLCITPCVCTGPHP